MEDVVASLPIPPADEVAARHATERWNTRAKPIGGLGRLEDAVVQIAALTGSERVDISRRCVLVLCADNGVVAQGVSQSGPEVTALVARSVAVGRSSVCRMAEPFGIDWRAVDVGMREPVCTPGIFDRRIAAGTADITQGPAMSRTQALRAVQTGVELVGEMAADGYQLLVAAELGIGNTTTATAMTCAFAGLAPEAIVGRGAGLSDAGLRRKTEAIRQALEVNAPDANDPLDVLAKLGGFDIAALVGVFLGGARYRVPIVIDGLISAVAAYCALRLRPECRIALLASHLPAEPAGRVLMGLLGLQPPIDAGLHLGEGTGGVCLVPLLDMALALYRDGASFADYGMQPYEVSPA